MRLLRRFTVICGLLALTVFAAAHAADERSDVTSKFHAGTTEWVAAYNAGEPERIVALYADDAVVMPPDAPSVSGHAAIRAYLTQDIATSREAGITLAITHGDAGAAGDMGWHAGTFKVTNAGGQTVGTGKFMEIWERRDGKWLMIRDIWNNDAPPAASGAG